MSTRLETDMLVVGGGPAGLAAAITARQAGARVVLVDDNPGLGGQIWRGQEQAPTDGEAWWWILAARRSGATLCRGTRVIDQPHPGLAVAERAGERVEIRHRVAVLATGARELFLPFPGWTLPGVCGAGGLQALVKGGLPIAGRTVAVAGSGPLLWPVAAGLRARGARVVLLAEQASHATVRAAARLMLAHPGKLAQAAALRARLAGVPWETDAWPLRAQGDGRLREVVFRVRHGERSVACDYLACGFGLIPNLEVPALFGVGSRPDGVRPGPLQETSAPGVFVAGETSGVAGVESALLEGRIAALAAVGQTSAARALLPARTRAAAFGHRLTQLFAPRPERLALATPDTLICRCEDVPWRAVAACREAREAKLHTRFGMGACQGRLCGAAAAVLRGWTPDTGRPPAFPVPCSVLESADGA
jgi:NADPH-dependent 2,4-dienoyl-CoA reductase/sulfur reductase-like enzyme